MIALWTLARGFVGVMSALCWMMVSYFRRRHQRAEAIAASPETSSTGPGGWCELERLEARRDEYRLARSLKWWTERKEGWKATQEGLGKARSRRLAYAAGAVDAWLLWALERSGTFDVWEFAVSMWAAVVSLGA